METEKHTVFQKLKGYIAAAFGVFLITAVLAPFHSQLNLATVSLALLLLVLFIATVFGSRPAFLASVVGVLCFNFFFLPPLYTFTIAEPQNWIAFAAFLATDLTAGQLSAKAKQRAEEAEKLYRELQNAFEKASEAEALRQSEKLKSSLLDAVTNDLRTPLTSIKASVLIDRVTADALNLQTENPNAQIPADLVTTSAS
jgi:K+-sensing histidine kinase KdpD